MNGSRVRAIPIMGTIVSIEIVEPPITDAAAIDADGAIERAFEWFREVERRCSRFDDTSELRQLIDQPGRPVPVGEILFSATAFALTVAEETDGAFDPTVGAQMEARGFDRHYATGQRIAPSTATDGGSYRDIALDPAARTITLRRPLVLDLGAVVKGLAIDLAARELAAFPNFAIDAGGDLYVAGRNASSEPWRIGIRHPHNPDETIQTLTLCDTAVCTSGGYERTTALGHHILDPRDGRTAEATASATAIAPTAMLADALATAAFVLGPVEGIGLLERHGVEGLLFSASLERFTTRGLSGSLLPHT